MISSRGSVFRLPIFHPRRHVGEVEIDVEGVGDVQHDPVLAAGDFMGSAVPQPLAALGLGQHLVIIQIIGPQLLRNMALLDTDRVQLPVLPVAAPGVDEEFEVFPERPASLFQLQRLDESQQRGDLRLVFLVEERLPPGDNPVLEEDLRGLQKLPERALPAGVSVRQLLQPEEGQLDLSDAHLLQKSRIVRVPDQPPEAGQLEPLRLPAHAEGVVPLPARPVAVAEVRFPQPAVENNGLEIRPEIVHQPGVRAGLHDPVGHMSQPAVAAPVGTAVQICHQIKRFMKHSSYTSVVLYAIVPQGADAVHIFSCSRPAGIGNHKGIFAIRNTKVNWEF
jgi:hypothetical protein